MNENDEFLKRMLRNMRATPPQPRDESLPLGFATRIAATWAQGGGSALPAVWLWERLCLRAAVAGVVPAVVTLSASVWWPASSQAWDTREAAELELMLGFR
jgi:hypothetical protein